MIILKNILSFVKKHTTILLLAVIAILILLLWHKPKPETKIVDLTDYSLYQELDNVKIKNGGLEATVTQLQLDKEEVIKRADSLGKLLKIKPKHIQDVTAYTSKIDTSFKTTPYKQRDTIAPAGNEGNAEAIVDTTVIINEFHDKWVDIVSKIRLDSNIGEIYLQIRDSAVIVNTAKHSLFGPSEYKTHIYNSNPYIQKMEGYSYTVKKLKDPFLSIVPYLGYDPFQKKVSAGIAVVPNRLGLHFFRK